MRTANRTPVTLKIKFKSTTLEQFIERYSVDISHGGIFIRTKDPLPVGTSLKFEFQLKDASPLITGDGTVVWTRDFDPTRSGVAPGMGVRFDRLPSESQEVLEKILAHKTAKLGKAPESFLDTPTKVAFGNVPTKVAPKDILEGLAQAESRRTLLGVGMNRVTGKSEDATPLPVPQPFHNDLDEFPDEAFEEATKVAALDALARRSLVEDSGANPMPFGKSLEEDVTVERRGRVSRPPGLRETGPIAANGSAAASATAPIFHDLPNRSPFVGAGPEQVLGAERKPVPVDDLDDRPDPFSLPPPGSREEAEAAEAARPSHRLRIVPPAPSSDAGQPESESPAAQGSVTGATPVPRESSNMPWIAAALLVLLIGGIGGFLLLSDDDKASPQAGQKSAPGPVATPAPAPAAAASQDTAAAAGAAVTGTAPAPQGMDVTITSVPEGALAELIGGSQSGPTPMTFRGLAAGQHYQVKLSKAGFVLAEMTLKPEAGDPPAFELEAKPSVLRVTSEPSGAQVWINGRRQRSLTPVDVRLSRRTTDSKQVKLALRKTGYSTAEQQISLDDLVDQGDAMVQEVALVLARRTAAAEEDAESGTDGEDSSEQPAGDSDGEAVGPARENDKEDASASSDGDKPDGKEDPAIVKPDIPDWMKP
jgi:uncharacterized protein (TIGR02266 family)